MGRRIRADLDGQLMGFRRDEDGQPIRVNPVTLSAGDEVPDDVIVSKRHLAPADPETAPGAGSGGGQDTGNGAPPAEPPFDPDAFTVDEVNEKLEGLDDAEVRAVIEVELSKRARHGIVQGPAARRLPHSD